MNEDELDIFSDLNIPEENEEPTPAPAPEPEEPTPTPAPEVKEEVKPEVSNTNIEQFDQFYNYRKQMDEYKAQLDAYKQKEEEQNKKPEEHPDPLYDPKGYTKWIEDRIKSQQDLSSQNLQRLRNDITFENITTQLSRSRKAVEEQYGPELLGKVEAWASEVLKTHPKEAIQYLQQNPTYDYLVQEYNKVEQRNNMLKDPDAYVMKRYQELTQANTNPAPPKKQSISSIPSARDPKPDVPVFLQGL